MTKKLFDLSDEDVAALERLRAARGLRSHVEVIRALIRENADQDGVTVGVVNFPKPAGPPEMVELTPATGPTFVKGVREVEKPAQGSRWVTTSGEPLPEIKPGDLAKKPKGKR